MVETDDLKSFFLLSHYIWRQLMHNLIPFNQLAGENQDPHEDLITEYYECLIDCDDKDHVCKRVCREVF